MKLLKNIDEISLGCIYNNDFNLLKFSLNALIINYSNIEHYLFDNSQTFRLLELSKPLGETIDFELGNFIKEHTNLKLRDSFIEANVLNLRKEKYLLNLKKSYNDEFLQRI